jgi:hypothetical protein
VALNLMLRFALTCAPLLAYAADIGVPDPTRPPPQAIPQPASAATDALPPAEPVLQSILVTSKGKSAMIDGIRYKIGDTVAGLRLVAISSSEVLLDDTGARKTLRLFPKVDMRQNDASKISKQAATGSERK